MKSLSQILAITVLSLAAFVACKKNGGGNSAPPTATCTINQVLPQGQYCNNGIIVTSSICNPLTVPPAGMMCMNGTLVPMNAGGVGNLLSNVGFTNSSMQGLVNFSGSGNFDFNNPQVAYFYSGQVNVTGTLQVTNQSLCGAPMGTYSISGTGAMSMGAIGNMTLTMTGPAQMQLLISNAVVDNPAGLDRNSSSNRFGILNSGLYVNGTPCGSITSY